MLTDFASMVSNFESENNIHVARSFAWTRGTLRFAVLFRSDQSLAMRARIDLTPSQVDYQVCGSLHNLAECNQQPICQTTVAISTDSSMISKRVNCSS